MVIFGDQLLVSITNKGLIEFRITGAFGDVITRVSKEDAALMCEAITNSLKGAKKGNTEPNVE